MKTPLLERLNALNNVIIEKWNENGIRLKAASFSMNGRVNSGITSCGTHFYRVWTDNFTKSHFMIGK